MHGQMDGRMGDPKGITRKKRHQQKQKKNKNKYTGAEMPRNVAALLSLLAKRWKAQIINLLSRLMCIADRREIYGLALET